MLTARHILVLAAMLILPLGQVCAQQPVWPPPPAEPRVAFVREIIVPDLEPHRGFWGKVGRILGGSDEAERLGAPVDVVFCGDRLFMTCRDLPALVEVDLAEDTYRLHTDEDIPLGSPIALAALEGQVFVSDSATGVVYRLADGEFGPWISSGLTRPTGLAVDPVSGVLAVVDTGTHEIRLYDVDGGPLGVFGSRGAGESGLNFPTFICRSDGGYLVNDTMNHQIKRFSGKGALVSYFGEEGDGPGTFARPKGLAVSEDGFIWVVDALFDNIQVFDHAGTLLLVLGEAGQQPGHFWSPTGLCFRGSELYVADTFNHRIQVLQYLGGDS